MSSKLFKIIFSFAAHDVTNWEKALYKASIFEKYNFKHSTLRHNILNTLFCIIKMAEILKLIATRLWGPRTLRVQVGQPPPTPFLV